MGSALSGLSLRRNGDGKMQIFVQSSSDYGNFALEVDGSNTVQDVLGTILPAWRLVRRPKPELYFNGHLLERAKSLAKYGIQDGSILHLSCTNYIQCSANVRERPNIIIWKRRRIIIIDRPLAIWEKEHDKTLLGLLVEQIQNGGTESLDFENNSWRDIVVRFIEATRLKYEGKHLYERFNFYAREYHIVNRIRHHPKFSWDNQRQVVIATDANWNEYIKGDPDARPYRRRAVPYIDLLEIVFADKEES